MTLRAVAVVIALAFCIGGCSRNSGLRCENQARYEGAEEAAPLMIPDGLDPPGEAEALRIPAEGGATAAGESQASGQQPVENGDAASCTEAPPDFFQEGSPG
ncbi:MAG: hypothetical protein F4053_16275 [Proteobacteria bacterium]|nr:hypothetical protein [Pseudomonadota bacterium]MYJ97070.1 hypothetical protein [Pseudomonadota bacterium]